MAIPAPAMPAMNHASRFQLLRGRMLHGNTLATFMFSIHLVKKFVGIGARRLPRRG
jgi:hypothetical protein